MFKAGAFVAVGRLPLAEPGAALMGIRDWLGGKRGVDREIQEMEW